MKKYILLGVIALVLLALPAAVAADNKAQTVVSGSIATSITVTVDNTALDLGPMDVGINPAIPGYVNTTVHVNTTGPVSGWGLKAKDTGTVKTGWLLDGTTFLNMPLGFAWGTPTTWTDLTVERSIASGTGPAAYPDVPTDVFFRQEVIAGDPVGTYTMTVEFDGILV